MAAVTILLSSVLGFFAGLSALLTGAGAFSAMLIWIGFGLGLPLLAVVIRIILSVPRRYVLRIGA